MDRSRVYKTTIRRYIGVVGSLILAFSISGCKLSSDIHRKSGKFFIKDNRDGKSYQVAKINGRWWMVDNFALDPDSVHYKKKDGNESLGLTYQWEQVSHAAPEGWRMPTAEELSALFLAYGRVSYSGELPMYRERFGPYHPDSTLVTYQSLMDNNRLHLPNDQDPLVMHWNENPERKFRTLFWTGDTNGERVYAIYWNKNTGVHFSAYPKNFYGFCRYVKIKRDNKKERRANQKLREKRIDQEKEELWNRFQFE